MKSALESLHTSPALFQADQGWYRNPDAEQEIKSSRDRSREEQCDPEGIILGSREGGTQCCSSF